MKFGTNSSDRSHRKIEIKRKRSGGGIEKKVIMLGYLRQRNFIKLKQQLKEGNYFLQRIEIELIQGLRVERVN